MGPDSLVDVPENGWGNQTAWDGTGYLGGVAYHAFSDIREHLGAELLEPLEVGQTYQVNFRVSLAEGDYWWTGLACDRIGALFTMTSNAWVGTSGPTFAFRDYAQVYSPEIVTDSIGWTLVSGSFTADSAYRFLVLGNFFTNPLTDTTAIPGRIGGTAYYYIDGVCVAKGDGACLLTGISNWYEDQARPSILWDHGMARGTVTWPGHEEYGVQVIDAVGRMVMFGFAQGERFALRTEGWAKGIYVARFRWKQEADVIKFVMIE